MEKLFRQQGMTLMELTVVLLIMIALAGLVVPYVGNSGSVAMCQTTDASMQTVKEAIMGGPVGAGYYADMLGKYPQDLQGLVSNTTPAFNLYYLFSVTNPDATRTHQSFNAKTGVGWRGPYLTTGLVSPVGLDTSFGASSIYAPPSASTPNPTGKVHDDITIGIQVLDGWHRPIVLQVPYDTSTSQYNFDYARLVSAGPDASINTKIQYDGSVSPFLPDAADREDDRVLYLKYPDRKAGGNIACSDL